jgi:hypothetical protein
MISALSEFDSVVRCIELAPKIICPSRGDAQGETWKRLGCDANVDAGRDYSDTGDRGAGSFAHGVTGVMSP